MSKVNFVGEFNMFMRFARDNSLSMRERMLWVALFYIANDRAVYDAQTADFDWPDGFIPVSHNELNLYCCLDKRGIESARNLLKQRGLIDFQQGRRNAKNPAYRMIYASVSAGGNVGYKNVPNHVPMDVPVRVSMNAPVSVPMDAPVQPPIYINNNKQDIAAGIESERADTPAWSQREIPSLLDVECYVIANKLCVDAKTFFNHYTANGWTSGGKPICDWRAKAQLWHARELARDKPQACACVSLPY